MTTAASILTDYVYIPVQESVSKIVAGTAGVGYGCWLKTKECFTGQTPYTCFFFEEDAPSYHIRVGVDAIKDGVVKILPTVCVAFTVYVVVSRVI